MELHEQQVKYIDAFSISDLSDMLESKSRVYAYVYSLKSYTQEIIEELLERGYKDKTDKDGKTNKGEFNYLVCKDKKTIKIFVKVNTRVSVTLVDFCNIVSGNKTQLLETYKKDTVAECMQEAIEQLQAFGMSECSTIGGASLKIFRENISYNFNIKFPHKIYDTELPNGFPFLKNVGDLVRSSYSGGWCYLNPEYSDKKIDSGVVLDENSLYPYCMTHFDYPIGKPTLIWKGEYPKEYEFIKHNRYLFYVILTKFSLKDGMLPFVKVKNDFRYKHNDTPVKVDNTVMLVLNQTDMELFKKCYNIDYLEYLGGVMFQKESGESLFGDYIHKLYEIKQNSDGVIKHTAKMLLNNLGGKFGSGKDSTHYVYDNESKRLKVKFEWNRRGSYIPVASAMTAYARMLTMSSAIENKDRFIYSDTDSLHLVGTEIPNNIKIGNDLGEWKVEDTFSNGYYAGQKQYSFQADKVHKYYVGEDILESPIKFVVAGMTDPEKWAIIEQTDVPSKLLKEQKNIC